jgi:hypothetical protein
VFGQQAIERVLHGADVRDLRSDVEVQELEAVEHAFLLQAVDGRDDLGRRQAELRAVARRLDPLARALGRETGADAEEIIGSEYNSDDHAASKEACAFLDAFITEGGKDRTEAQSRSNTAALLRRLAELVEQGNSTKEDS